MEKTFFSYDNAPMQKAYSRTTHLTISAHQDDIEFMAYNAIVDCFHNNNNWFSAVVMTDGKGSPRSGIYQNLSDDEMREIRIFEQKKAAFVGEYSSLTMLDYSSADIKNSKETSSIKDLAEIINKCEPKFIYTHNPADKHPTHIAAMLKVIKAIRMLDLDKRPQKLYGCEVWRSLDWVPDNKKITFDVSSHPNLANALMGVFDSQIAGGKRYDIATIGRRASNATYGKDHSVDAAQSVSYAIDMTPLIMDNSLSVTTFISQYINEFANNVNNALLDFE